MDFEYNITYRQKDKGWQYIISFKDHNGKWKQRSKQGFKTKRAARKAADERLEEMKEQSEVRLNAEYEGITFKEFAKVFLKHKSLYKEGNTIKNYRTAVRKFKDLNDLELSKITTLDIQECVDKMIKEGLESSSIQTYRKNLSTVFKNAIEPYRIIAENPVTNLTIPEDKKEEKVKALTRTQLDMLLNSIKNRKHYIISLIAAKTGLRIGEILGLTWDNIDFTKGTITVNKQWKLLQDGTWGFGSVKRKKSNRIVPAPSSLLKALKEYKKANPINFDGRIAHYADTNIANYLAKQYRKAGFNITVHDLRHTYATLLIANGVDFKTVAELLGHDVEMTIKTYSHVTNDMLENAAKKVNQIFL